MYPDERLRNIIESAKLGPLTPFWGLVNGVCECGKPKSERHKPGKHPRFGGWQDKQATTDPQTISRWVAEFPNANFAVITGVDTVVLDLDIRPGKNGVEELARLEAEAGQTIPPTVTVMSGSGTGAKHLYFTVPPDVANLQKPKGTKAIDFQRSLKAIIIPGSLHESGRSYEFAPGLSPAEVAVADLPGWLLALMQKSGSSIRIPGVLTDDIGKLFEQLLKTGPPPGSTPPGRLRPDEIVKRKMKTVTMRKYPDDRSFSDSYWAWTLARNCCHHWDQFLRLWEASPIRKLPGTKCNRTSYEGPLLNKAFADQKQQWKSKLTKRSPGQSANPSIAKRVQKEAATHREVPRSPVTKAVLALHNQRPDLDDTGIARVLNETGQFEKPIPRNNVKRIRHSYPQYW
jgi:hypothetical protein